MDHEHSQQKETFLMMKSNKTHNERVSAERNSKSPPRNKQQTEDLLKEKSIDNGQTK